ncbi:tannase-domain-containing protein [Aspergillus sclerotioniger CBS 115572]|uniref:Carboxylic ester hydrolase n=1 Tax=Aspergillus sclerotioniger CBS 115572 TaxID=1450535 RepID=A0A317X7A8_9EURO|nr:tannase-domain-containing protein [Aspergillus sclerotioniger CBS 115572]PWY93437.1 tannase-domain-containing protein [Aspergillus sclerotioniger CBS 115572]
MTKTFLITSILATLARAAIDYTWDAVSAITPSNVSLSFVQAIPENGTFVVPSGNTGWPTNPIHLPELCAVGATVPGDTQNGTFGFGPFLPVQWNGRTLTVGNGGLAGGVNWVDMGTGVKYGHAVLSTDNGHNSTSTDASWSYQNPAAQTNLGGRALHETVVYGKEITEAFYGTEPAYHYYQGCSTGGRQGFKEAEMFLDDFDGVIAGAPAWWTSHQQICPYTTPNSTLFFPSWLHGSEHFWSLNIDSGNPNIIGLGYIQYTLGLGATWNWRDYNSSIQTLSSTLNAGQADASDYNLTPFYRSGKKLIHYHGMSDGGIATGASYYLYKEIDRAMRSSGGELDEFYLFTDSGDGHCVDTATYVNAPYYIAGISMTNNGQYSVPGYQDPKHDVLLALMNWVENGTAPKAIIGTAYENFTTMEKITRQRPILLLSANSINLLFVPPSHPRPRNNPPTNAAETIYVEELPLGAIAARVVEFLVDQAKYKNVDVRKSARGGTRRLPVS